MSSNSRLACWLCPSEEKGLGQDGEGSSRGTNASSPCHRRWWLCSRSPWEASPQWPLQRSARPAQGHPAPGRGLCPSLQPSKLQPGILAAKIAHSDAWNGCSPPGLFSGVPQTSDWSGLLFRAVQIFQEISKEARQTENPTVLQCRILSNFSMKYCFASQLDSPPPKAAGSSGGHTTGGFIEVF